MSFPMIDVSSNNHGNNQPIDWHEVAKHGVRGVMIKATEGSGYTNPWLGRDAHGARAAGLHVGYYHFAQPDDPDGKTQADYCLKAIEGLPRDLGVALDLETTNGLGWGELATFAKTFLQALHDSVVIPSLYVNPTYLDNLPGAPFGHKLWLADWEHSPRRECWIWQHGIGIVPGVPGKCDLDTYYG